MQCVTCGVKLPPGISTCFYCGTPTPYNATGNSVRRYASQAQDAPFTNQAEVDRFSSGSPPPQGQRPPFAGAEPPSFPGRQPSSQGNNSPFSSFPGVDRAPFPERPQPFQNFTPQSPSLSGDEPSAFPGSQRAQGFFSEPTSFQQVDVHPFPPKEHTSGLVNPPSSQPLDGWQPSSSSLFNSQGSSQTGGLWQPSQPPAARQPSANSMSTAQQFFAEQGQQPPRTEPTSQTLFPQAASPQSQPRTPSQARPFETGQMPFPSAGPSPSWPLVGRQASSASAPANPPSFSNGQPSVQPLSPSLSSFSGKQSFSMNPPASSPSVGGQSSPFSMSPSLPRTPSNSALSSLPGVSPQETPLAIPPQDVPTPSGPGLKRSVVVAGFLILVLVLAFSSFLLVQNRSQQAQVKPPTPTPVPTLAPITTTDPQALYTQATARKPVLSDPLKAQGNNAWGIVSTGGDCSFHNGSMQVNGPQGAKVTICTARGAPNFGNFAYQVQATSLSGDTVGIVFRADAMGRKLYLFSITTQGVYLLSSYDQPGFQAHIIAGGTSKAINKGQNKSNQIAAIARGKTIYLYVNKQFITKVDDTTSTTGLIGTLVGDTQGASASATFSNAQVWSV